jgi:hypothetical protein
MKTKPNLPEAIREYFREQGRIGGYRRAQNMTPDERKASSQWANAVKAQKKKKGA